MKNYRLVHAFVHAGIAALLYAFLTHSERLNAFAYADYIRGAVLLVLPFLFVQSNRIADIMVERIPGLSFAIRKALTGSDFVEGDWPLVVMQADGRSPKYFGFMTITYKNGQLLIHGDDWNPDGSLAVKFRSQQSQCDGRLLQYWYAQGANLNTPAMFGYTRIYFFPDQGPVERHAGEFLDKEHSSQLFFAERLRHGWFGKRAKTKEEKFAAAKSFWVKIEPRFQGPTPPTRMDCDFV